MTSLLDAVMAVPIQRAGARLALAPCTICRYTMYSTETRAHCRHRVGTMHLVCHASTCVDKECVETSCKRSDCEVARSCDACQHRWCEEHSQPHAEDLEHCAASDRDVCRQCHLDSCRSRECWDDDAY